jgi:hypothetical protein
VIFCNDVMGMIHELAFQIDGRPTAKLSLTECSITSAFMVPWTILQVDSTGDEVGIKTIDSRTLGEQHTVIMIPEIPVPSKFARDTGLVNGVVYRICVLVCNRLLQWVHSRPT